MKLILINLLLAFMIAPVLAQNTDSGVRFVLTGVEGDEVPESTAVIFDTKLREALNRTSALSETPDGVFAIRPTLTIGEAKSTEGMVQEVNMMRAELLLQALNVLDGNVFYSVTVPLSVAATGSKETAMRKMASSIKVTDPVYVRFVRTARKKIDAYYTENCATILQRAQTLADTGKERQAAQLLDAVPAEADCYQQARMLLADIGVIPEAGPDTVVVETFVIVPVEVPVAAATPDPVPDPVPQSAPAPVPAADPAPISPRIKVNHPENFSFKVLSCTGIRIGEQVRIVAEIVNKNMHYDNCSFSLSKAIDNNGNSYNRNQLLIKGYTSTQIDTPRNVKVKFTMTVTGVSPDVREFSYLHLYFSDNVVEIYDLPINWINE